jgi:hypothetical protein
MNDPQVLHILAERYGREISGGEASRADAISRLAAIALWHKRCGPEHFDDVFPRVIETLDRAVYADELAASREIRDGIAPLLTKRAPSSDIRRRAYELSAARLLRPVCDAIVHSEIQARLSMAVQNAR